MTVNIIERLDGLNSTVAFKAPCDAVSAANIVLEGEQTVGSVAVVTGDRVLVTGQNDASENGIYDVSTAGWVRSPDFDGIRDAVDGTFVSVKDGVLHSIYQLSCDTDPPAIGETDLTFILRQGGNVTYPLSPEEADSGLNDGDIVNSSWPAGYLPRYGVNSSPGVTDMTDAAGVWASVQGVRHVVPFDDYMISDTVTFAAAPHIYFEPGARIMSGDIALTGFWIEGTEPTSFVDLSADALTGETEITVTSATGIAIGDWIELRSEALLPGENSQSRKTGELFKVLFKSGNTLSLNGVLGYDYLTADDSQAGVCVMFDGVTVENFTFNSQDHPTTAFRPIRFKYCANLNIRNMSIYNTRVSVLSDGAGGDDGLIIGNSVNVRVTDITIENIKYYGINLYGPCRDVVISNIHAAYCRHSFSINWADEYGEPRDVTVREGSSYYSTLSGWDTHDLGYNVTFDNLSSYYADDDGIQIRCRKANIINCRAYYSDNDGLSLTANATDCKVRGGEYRFNDRHGIWGLINTAAIDGVDAGSNGEFGIIADGGRINNCRLNNNGTAAINYGSNSVVTLDRLLVTGCYAPGSVTQDIFIYQYGSVAGRTYDQLIVTNNMIPGYASARLAFTNEGASGADMPFFSGNITSSDGTGHEGVATLAGGTVTVTTDAVVKCPASTFNRAVYSSIDLTAIETSANEGSLRIGAITDQTSFVIESSNASDDRDIFWKVTS